MATIKAQQERIAEKVANLVDKAEEEATDLPDFERANCYAELAEQLARAAMYLSIADDPAAVLKELYKR